MDLRKLLLTENECYKVGKSMTPTGVMWHSTGANNPNLRRYVNPDDGKLGVNIYNNHWNTAKPGGRQVCVHAFIGKDKNGNIATYQTLPFDMRGWHAGGSANDNYIGFEICEDSLTDKAYFDKVYQEAVEFTAYLCELYKLDPMGKNVIICHADGYKLGIASNHGDIYHWFKNHGKTMDDVRNDVKSILDKSAAKENKTEAPEELYRIRKTWADSKSQLGAYKVLDNAKKEADKYPGYYVFNSKGVAVYPVNVKKIYSGTFPTLPSKGYLAKGDKGAEVGKLQKFLNWYGNYGLAVDNSFGAKTDEAVRKYQKAEALTVDGKFGKKSLAKAKTVKR